jgi:hypothetical protein
MIFSALPFQSLPTHPVTAAGSPPSGRQSPQPLTALARRKYRGRYRRTATLGGATLGFICALLSAERSAWAQFNFSTVALTGQPAPGTPAGVSYSDFGSEPTLNAVGQVAFVGELAGSGVTNANNNGLWSGAPGNLMILAREGAPAPGTPAGVSYGFVGFVLPLNAPGQSAYFGFLTGAGVSDANNIGLWSGAPGGVALLARTGDQAPGTAAGVNYAGLGDPIINDANQSLFVGSLTGPGVTSANDVGIWLGAPGSVALVVREGNPAPGLAAGVVLLRLRHRARAQPRGPDRILRRGHGPRDHDRKRQGHLVGRAEWLDDTGARG